MISINTQALQGTAVAEEISRLVECAGAALRCLAAFRSKDLDAVDMSAARLVEEVVVAYNAANDRLAVVNTTLRECFPSLFQNNPYDNLSVPAPADTSPELVQAGTTFVRNLAVLKMIDGMQVQTQAEGEVLVTYLKEVASTVDELIDTLSSIK